MNKKTFRTWAGVFGLLGAAIILTASNCKGDDGQAGASGTPADPPPIDTQLSVYEDLPGVVMVVTGLSGASGSDGSFQAGDQINVTYTVKKNDGTTLPIGELDTARIYVSGPTFNYQRVINLLSDLATASTKNSDGSYTYGLPAIPATYNAPYNDTVTFGAGDGELQGTNLLAGTYTVGIEAYKNYWVEGVQYRDVANVTKDFLFGGATTLEPREVVTLANCNQCHQTLQAHGTFRRELTSCLLCHTSGAEDKNVSTVEGGTPDVSIDFKVMIHKIHSGKHLPSVLGVATNSDGSRNYSATAKPYKVVGFGNGVHDFSEVAFPVWPNLGYPTPRDQGYTALTSAQKNQEDTIRSGITACAKCHGDPDGSGPLPAPAQGNLAYTQPSRQSCSSCHDDIDWAKPYTANGSTMPAQANDSACALCHVSSGNNLDTITGHTHPIVDSALNPGLHVMINTITPSTGGSMDPGEKLQVNLSITNDAGSNADPSTDMDSIFVVIAGPTNNRQLVLNTTIPKAKLGSIASSYTLNVPQPTELEFLGDATGAAETKMASMAPFWTTAEGAAVTVFERTATGAGETVTTAAIAGQNFVEVSTGSTFSVNKYVVIADGTANEEYLRVMGVVGNKVYFGTMNSQPSQPYLRYAHPIGTAVSIVTLTTKTLTTDYTLTEAAGQVHPVAARFTAGNAVIVSYTTDFVMPSTYPPPFNDSLDLDETWGKWATKSIESGTYTLGIWVRQSLSLSLYGESQTYRLPSLLASGGDFLVGSGTTIQPYSLISSVENCASCHNQVQFHGGSRRGAGTCLICHSTAGAEDGPKYRWGSAADTTGVMVGFRSMLHKIHRGSDLTKASTYAVVGFNGASHAYEKVEFPAMPGKTKHCATCHGSNNTAWKIPSNRDHSTLQTLSVRNWRETCGSCHDSNATAAHIDLQTSSGGVESCTVCHGEGKEYEVELRHKNR